MIYADTVNYADVLALRAFAGGARLAVARHITTLRYFSLDGTDHASHQEQASMIRRYIIWRNNHAYDELMRHSNPCCPKQ